MTETAAVNPLIADPQSAATDAQIAYLTKLFSTYEIWTGSAHSLAAKFAFQVSCKIQAKGQASEWIDLLKADVTQAKSAPKHNGGAASSAWGYTSAPLVGALSYSSHMPPHIHNDSGQKILLVDPANTGMPEYGYYQLENGSIWHWQKGNPASKIVSAKFDRLRKLSVSYVYKWDHMKAEHVKVMDANGNPEVKKISWVKAGGLYDAKKTLAGAKVMTLKEAGALGKKFQFCIRCSTKLSDPISVANGYGPVCAAYFG